MTKPKRRVDLALSSDVDWQPHQPVTLVNLVAEARAISNKTDNQSKVHRTANRACVTRAPKLQPQPLGRGIF
jgi:hypothetical protein